MVELPPNVEDEEDWYDEVGDLWGVSEIGREGELRTTKSVGLKGERKVV